MFRDVQTVERTPTDFKGGEGEGEGSHVFAERLPRSGLKGGVQSHPKEYLVIEMMNGVCKLF